MFKPKPWRYEPVSVKRQRDLSQFDMLRDAVSPLVARGDPLSLLKAQQTLQAVRPQTPAKKPWMDRVAQAAKAGLEAKASQEERTLSGAPMDVVNASDQRKFTISHQPSGKPVPGVPLGVAEAGNASPGDRVYQSGSSAPHINPFASLLDNQNGLPGPLQKALDNPVLGPALTEAARPANWVAALAAPETAAATRGIPWVGRVAAAALDMGGGPATRIGTQIGAATGGRIGSHLAGNAVPEDAPAPVHTGAELIGGLLGGLGGAVAGGGIGGATTLLKPKPDQLLEEATAAVKQKFRPAVAGGSPPLNPAAVLQTAVPGSALHAAATQAGAQGPKATLPAGIARSLDQARAVRVADEPGTMARAFYRVPGMKSVFRPGLNMPDHIVEAYTAEGAAKAELEQQAFATRRPLYNQLDREFGNGATDGASLPVTFLGTPQEAEYPGTGTLYDILQRPEKYNLTPDQLRMVSAYDARNENLRLIATEDFGADIGKFTRDQGGAYVPNIDRSQAVQDIEEAIGKPSGSAAASGRAKARFYETGYDRWLADQEAVRKGRLKPSQVFTPETNIRALTEGMDSSKERMVGSQVFRAGLGGKTKLEVLQETHPELAARMTALTQRLSGMRGTAASLDARLQRAAQQLISGEGLQVPLTEQSQRVRAAAPQHGESELLSTLRGLPDLPEIQSQIDELRAQLSRNAQGALLSNKTNRSTVQTIADYEAWAEVKAAFDQSGGDAARANEVILRRLEDWSNAAESRRNPGLRASLTKNRGAKQARARMMTGGLGSDQYTKVNARAGGDEEYAILSAKADALNSLYEMAQADSAGQQLDDALQSFTNSPMDNADVDTLLATVDATLGTVRDKLKVTVGPYRMSPGPNYGKTAPQLRSDIASLKQEIAALRPAWKAANPRGYQFVGDGIYRYFPADQAGQITTLLKTDGNPFFDALASMNASILSGDFSPLIGQQGQVAWLTAPLQTSQAVFGGLARGIGSGDILRGFRADALAEDIAANPTSWGDFAFHTGHSTTPGAVPEEFGGGWIGKIPKVGAKFAEANDAIYTAVIRAQKRMWDDAVADLGARGVAPDEAKAIAGRNVMGIIPTSNRQAAGISASHMKMLRSGPTSLTFVQRPAQMITDATEGLANLAIPGKTITERQRLALKAVVKMHATALTLSASTAAIYAQTKGQDPVEAALSAITPGNKDFMKVRLPNGMTIPLGGPYRRIFQALAPAPVKVAGGEDVWLPFAGAWNYARNTISPALRRPVDLIRNKDFYGDPIMTADFPLNILQAAEYQGEGMIPLTLGGGIEGVRKGADMGDTAVNAIGNALGSNVGIQSPTEKLNEISHTFVDPRTGKTTGRDFFDQEKYIQYAIRQAHPDLYNESLKHASPERKAAEAVKQVFTTQQTQRDQALASGSIAREDYVNAYYDALTEKRAKLEQIYGSRKITDPKNPTEKYMQILQNATDAKTGILDREQVDAGLANLSEADRAYIDRNVGYDDTPTAALFRDIRDARRSRNDLPKYKGFTGKQAEDIDNLWQEIRNNARSAEQYDMLRAMVQYLKDHPGLDQSVVSGVRRRIMGSLSQTKDRSTWDKAHPEQKLFYGKGKLTKAEQAQLQSMLGSRT